ncbi:ribosomal RNA large subunit methyltransferase J [Microbulbifer aestuariivivens]|uniref:Ribosomal RNA large subunit methyltransferase J n=1 Tax=Microbulbifer aestuariivivens TaxID=1908308 RepID=A0ABP9WS38_9GAMM
MLSYRHSFHAGNFADLLKHIVLVEILDHLLKKDTAFDYIDTHAGAGLYDLRSAQSQKTLEHSGGIARLNFADWPELDRYAEVVGSFNKTDAVNFYPGSPSIVGCFLRPQDRAWLFELHPQDYQLLQKNFAGRKNIRVYHTDGFDGLKALIPPRSRRGLVLIDPSYEIKSDYDLVIDQVAKAYKKFSQGIYAIWYPVVDRNTIQRMQKKLINSGIRNIQCFELGVMPDSREHGMTASGMLVINPPWTLMSKISALLPKLATLVSQCGSQIYQCATLVEE